MAFKFGNLPSGWISPEYSGGGTFGSYNNPYIGFGEELPIGFPTTRQPLANVLQTIRETATAPTTTSGGSGTTDINCSCLVGRAYVENGVCKCDTTGAITPVKTGTIDTPPIVVLNPLPTTPNGETTVLPSVNSIVDTIKANPLIAIGAAVGLYLLIAKK